ncbi:MAG: hypothetical protein MZV63_36705, partial [Marinilabiliales bacterium]|nr:hypothetical protein [Marinilabiliales bacterium]
CTSFSYVLLRLTQRHQNNFLQHLGFLFVAKTERRLPENVGHEMDWVRESKETPETRVATKSDFAEAGPFNEMVGSGCACSCLPEVLIKELEWNGEENGIHKYW